MKIFGVGTDIVKINRLKKIIKKKTYLSRIFNENESPSATAIDALIPVNDPGPLETAIYLIKFISFSKLCFIQINYFYHLLILI